MPDGGIALLSLLYLYALAVEYRELVRRGQWLTTAYVGDHALHRRGELWSLVGVLHRFLGSGWPLG
jgi:hypothetical protein